MNLYAYCGNDPINNYDPSGHFAITTLLISMAIGFGIGAGIGGATALGIIGWVTTFAGVSSGLFASAEYQEFVGAGNWIQDSTGMSDGLYNTLMISTATIATLGTFASSFCSSFNIK